MSQLTLDTWICDSCGEVISRPEDGYVEWISYGTGFDKGRNLRLVHKDSKKPEQGPRCQFDQTLEMTRDGGIVKDGPQTDYMGPDGLIRLLRLHARDSFDDGTVVLQMLMRLHIPGYERARKYLEEAVKDGFLESENYPFQSRLETIISHYTE